MQRAKFIKSVGRGGAGVAPESSATIIVSTTRLWEEKGFYEDSQPFLVCAF